MLEAMQIHQVDAKTFLTKDFNEPVYCQIDVLDYNQRKDGQLPTKQDFFDNPEDYKSTFLSFAKVADVFVAGHFYGEGAPYLFTREDAKREEFNIKVVADISCDIDGPVASTIRPSTIAEPIYGVSSKNRNRNEFAR